MASLNKGQLIESVAQIVDLPKTVSTKTIDAVLETITGALAKGGEVTIVGFGTFSVKKRSERKGRNPKTGEEITIPEAIVPNFKAGKALKDAVSQAEVE